LRGVLSRALTSTVCGALRGALIGLAMGCAVYYAVHPEAPCSPHAACATKQPWACWLRRCWARVPWLAQPPELSDHKSPPAWEVHGSVPRTFTTESCASECVHAATRCGGCGRRPSWALASGLHAHHRCPGVGCGSVDSLVCMHMLTACPPTQGWTRRGRHSASPANECTRCRQAARRGV